MLLITTVLPIVGILCFAEAATVENMDRIIGGDIVNIQEIPYQCSIAEKGSHVCGCSILSEAMILTAAHCLEDVNPASHDLEIRAGSNKHDSGGVVRKVKSFKIHPMFNSGSMDYDTAVICLESKLTFSNTIKSIELDEELPKDGLKALISGWGLTVNNGNDLSPLVKSAEITVMSRESCQTKTAYGKNIRESMFCARDLGADACQGDSGGPIKNLDNDKLIGVTSFGFECGSQSKPGIYSNIPKSLTFIKNAIKALQ